MSKKYLLTYNGNFADEHDVPAFALFTEKEYKEFRELEVDVNLIRAYLGNSGDCFEEDFEHYEGEKYGDMFDSNYSDVEVYEITDEIYNFLNTIEINRYSLTNLLEKDKEE